MFRKRVDAERERERERACLRLKCLTRLYSSSHDSSSHADIHFSTFSRISFLLEASSLTFAISESICSSNCSGSLTPKRRVETYYNLVVSIIYHYNEHSISQVYAHQSDRIFSTVRCKMKLFPNNDLPDSIASTEKLSDLRTSVAMCIFLDISSSSSFFLSITSLILVVLSLLSLMTSSSACKTKLLRMKGCSLYSKRID